MRPQLAVVSIDADLGKNSPRQRTRRRLGEIELGKFPLVRLHRLDADHQPCRKAESPGPAFAARNATR